MNELIYSFGEQNVRVVMKNNEPWFVATDICRILELTNATMAISKLDEDERSKFNLGRQGETNIVNEYGMYSLVLASRKKEAKQFKRWVTHDVLPSIRSTGSYSNNLQIDSYSIQDPIERAKRWIQEQEEKKALEEQLQLQAPKVVVADAITASSNSILIRDLAKILAQNGAVNVGEKRLFTWMRNNGYLTQKNVPTQRSIEMGIMELHERPVVMKDNQIKTYITPRISGKGQSYFIKKFLHI